MAIDDNPERPAPKVILRPVQVSIQADDSEARETIAALNADLVLLLARIELAREGLRALRAEAAEVPELAARIEKARAAFRIVQEEEQGVPE